MAPKPKCPEGSPITEEEQKFIDDVQTRLGEKANMADKYTLIRFLRGWYHEQEPEVESNKKIDLMIKWREEKEVEKIVHTKFEKEELFKSNWPAGFHGFGKSGHAIYVDRPGQINPAFLTENFTQDEIVNFHIQCMESLCRLKARNCEGKDSKDWKYKHIVILDLSGMGSKHCSSSFYTPLQGVIHIDQNYYPETLHKMIITNAPWVFKALWMVCSPWIDPITKGNILWGASNLKTYIDEESIPQFLGGKCKCEGGKCLVAPFNDGVNPPEDFSFSLPMTPEVEERIAKLSLANEAAKDEEKEAEVPAA